MERGRKKKRRFPYTDEKVINRSPQERNLGKWLCVIQEEWEEDRINREPSSVQSITILSQKDTLLKKDIGGWRK